MANRSSPTRRGRATSFGWFFGILVFVACSLLACLPVPAHAQPFDLVLLNGRVMDPESGLDAIRHVAIAGGRIAAVSERPLAGKSAIDAAGLVIAPGFVDLHQHGWDDASLRFKALDGVTTALELEVGTADVDRWYAEREGKLPVNYGVSAGHIPTRIAVMGEQPSFLPAAKGKAAKQPASPAQIEELKRQLEHGLQRGAVAVGFGLAYTPSATHWEVLEMFRVAARHRAPCHVHIRFKGETEPNSSVQALEEVIGAAAISGAPLHVVHIQSSGGASTPKLLAMITEARQRGLDVTTECYPYTAGMTDIKSALFDDGWQQQFGIDYKDLQWGATGERLTAETFAKYRKTGGLVILHNNPESIVRGAVAHPLTMIASDGLKQHPRNAGTYARILGKYVREDKALPLMDALRKMSLLPAQRLEARTPAMKHKGRIKVGADADLAVFDANTVIDRATFEQPEQPPSGIWFVLVNGVPVVKDGKLQDGELPGRAVRAPTEK